MMGPRRINIRRSLRHGHMKRPGTIHKEGYPVSRYYHRYKQSACQCWKLFTSSIVVQRCSTVILTSVCHGLIRNFSFKSKQHLPCVAMILMSALDFSRRLAGYCRDLNRVESSLFNKLTPTLTNGSQEGRCVRTGYCRDTASAEQAQLSMNCTPVGRRHQLHSSGCAAGSWQVAPRRVVTSYCCNSHLTWGKGRRKYKQSVRSS